MARIPEHEIERLKREVSVQRLAESQGVKLKRHGAELLGLCPFHDDKEPSLAINPKKNIWNCLGACKTGGSIIDWVSKTEGVSFRHAVELLQADCMPSLAADSRAVKRSTVQKLPATLERNAEDTKLLRQVIDYYHEALKQSPEALDYLKKRGITGEAIEQFKLGFANRTLGYRLPDKNRKEGAAIRGQLQRIGIIRSSGHEHFNGSLVIPVLDGQGNIQEVYGRKICDRLRKGTPKHLYLPGSHAGVWNIDALQASDEMILCESLIDALTFWVAGYRNVTASYGISGFTEDHLAAFKQRGIQRVLIAYDRDEAGEAAATALAAKLVKEGIGCYRIQFPKGMDANEYAVHGCTSTQSTRYAHGAGSVAGGRKPGETALSVQPASKSLGVVIRSAVWLGKGKTPKHAPVPKAKKEETATKNKNDQSPSFTAQPATNEGEPKLPAKPLPATVIPAAPKAEIEAEVTAEEVIITLGGEPRHPASGSHKAIPGQNRRYRIRGLDKNLSINQLKINLLASCGDALHVDTFDLYAAKSRGLFIKQVAIELDIKETIIKKDLGKILLKLEALQETQIKQTLKNEDKADTLDDVSREQALALLKDKNLLNRILKDFTCCGVVGEETNKLIGYLACVSRKLDNPLAIIIQSTSAAGKSSLMDAILNLMPKEERVQYSAMTGQSLFYMGETNLKNKILAIAEEEGAENARYALKLLQSEGELTIASTGKDETSGDLVTKAYHVEGPVMLFLTTTAIDIDEELMNRCLVLTVDESREQTRAIHAMQRKQQTLEGLLQSEDKKQLTQLHRNAQQLLKPLRVTNPYAEKLTFVDDKTRTRRDHMKYLALIRSIALLHQYQRETKTLLYNGQTLEYIEVIQSDIETANQLAHEVLGRSLAELPPQTLTLLKHIRVMVLKACQQQSIEQRDYRFSRRNIREATGWSDGQLKIHCTRLTELEYLLVHRGGRGQSLVYELLYDGDLDDKKHLMGLIDLETLNAATVPDVALAPASMQSYDEEKLGQNPQKTAPSQGQVRPKLGGSQGSETGYKPSQGKACSDLGQKSAEKALFRNEKENGSYRSGIHALAAEGSQ